MPFRVGPMELIILLVIVMLIFGVGRLPQIGNAVGKSIKEFRKVQEETENLLQPGVDASADEKVAEKS